MKRCTAAFLVALLLTGALAAQELEMTIGAEAPAIDVAHWLKVDAVPGTRGREYRTFEDFEDGKVYVLEFWATWCGPCKAGMPHLGELQERFADKGVTILGISDEPLPTVARWLSTTEGSDQIWWDRIHYSLATDPDESVKNDYFRAAGQRGIPCAFIIGKDGHVEWIGHPMRMDEPLAQVCDGSWDRDAFKVEWERAEMAKRMQQSMRSRMSDALRREDWKGALGLIDEQLEVAPENAMLLRQRFDILLFDDQHEEAYSLGQRLVEGAWEDPNQLNSIAWTIVDDQRIQTRDLGLAMKAASRASALTEHRNAAILDTLARVYFEEGNLEKALHWQRQAMEFAGEGAMGEGIRETLRRYEEEQKKREMEKKDEEPRDYF